MSEQLSKYNFRCNKKDLDLKIIRIKDETVGKDKYGRTHPCVCGSCKELRRKNL